MEINYLQYGYEDTTGGATIASRPSLCPQIKKHTLPKKSNKQNNTPTFAVW
jgi:hypothetical protein